MALIQCQKNGRRKKNNFFGGFFIVKKGLMIYDKFCYFINRNNYYLRGGHNEKMDVCLACDVSSRFSGM